MPPSDLRPDDPQRSFGCSACWPASAERALEARRSLVFQDRLVDESHYGVSLLACGACGQRFLSVFTERIDWTNGNDPQEYQLAPVSADEAAALVAEGTGITTPSIERAAAARYVLLHTSPSSGAPTTRWVPFLSVGWHD